MEGCTDGTWKGMRYFTCQFGRAFFCPVSSLIPDQTIAEHGNQANLNPSGTEQHIGRAFKEVPALNFSMGSTVQVGDPQAPKYGVVQWIGTVPGSDVLFAGIELVIPVIVFGICVWFREAEEFYGEADVNIYFLFCQERAKRFSAVDNTLSHCY